MNWSTPLVTEYESQYGPPQFEQDPNEITYFGSGIWSYTRFRAGAILSVTVPATTSRSAWRGPCANGITPYRMKSCFEVDAAMNSMAQHARPKFITHREYRRPQFRMNFTGWGMATVSMRPITKESSLGPAGSGGNRTAARPPGGGGPIPPPGAPPFGGE